MSVTDPDQVYADYAEQFILTGDRHAAALAAGVETDQVDVFLEHAKHHPIVVRMLALEETSVPNFADEEETRNSILKRLWRESNYRGAGSSAAARIAALKSVAEITGVEAPKKVDVTNNSGGMLLVPVMDVSAWEAEAERSQTALKEAARA